jgi:nicotinamidase/pyrazinamidase
MKALVIVDPQIDFCPGGQLAVPEGDQIFNYINTLTGYPIKIASKDMHPQNHKSFASNNPGKRAFMDVIQLSGEEVRLWPDHCVVGTPGADFHPALTLKPDYIVHKGMATNFNNYSPFFDNSNSPERQGEVIDAEGNRLEANSLLDFLSSEFEDELIDTVDVVGLATDYCVKAFVLDALKYDFKVRLLVPGCRGVNVNPTDVSNAIEEMRKAGAEIVDQAITNRPAVDID